MKYVLSVLISCIVSFSVLGKDDTAEEAQVLHDKGRECFNSGKIEEGREYTLKAMEIRKKLFGEVNEDYITSLNNYASSYSIVKDNQKATELQKKVLELCNQLSKPHPNIGMYTLNMGRYYYLTDDKTNAVKYWEQALPLVEKFGDMYESILEWLGMIYIDNEDIKNQERILALAEELIEYKMKQPCDEPKCMTERAEYCYVKGEKAKAKEFYLKALGMDMTPEQKSKTYESYAKFLMNEKDFGGSAEYYYMAAEAKKQTDGETEGYIQLIYNAAVRMYLSKQYDKSVAYYNRVIDFYDKKDSQAARKNIALCRKGMGNALKAAKDYVQAKEEYLRALDYYSDVDPYGKDYAGIIENIAFTEKFNKEYEASIKHYKEAISIYKKLGLYDKAQDVQNSLNLCYAYAGMKMDDTEESAEARALRIEKSKKIIDEEKSNLEIVRQYLGETQYARSLGVIAGSYYQIEDYENSVDYYQQYIKAIRGALRTDFQLMGEDERMLLWKEEKPNIDEIMELLVTLPTGYESLMPILSEMAYDCMLISKGILLNSSIEFGKVIASSGNESLKKAYENTKQITEEIKSLRMSAASDEDLKNILLLQQQNQQQQLALYRDCAEIADFTDYIGYDWRDVQSKLAKDDVAIEFAAVKTGIFDSDNYMAALVLTKDMSYPVALSICSFADLKNMKKDRLVYDSADAGNMVWGSLLPYLKDKSNVYFSADGDFNNIGIEYLQYDGKPLSEQKNVYRLSTTKQLCYNKQKPELENVALFGDIDYNDDERATIEDNTERSIESMRGAVKFSTGNMQFAYLANSRREINEIYDLLTSKKIDNIVSLSGTDASEKAFLSLNGTKVNLMHIATHGEYQDVEKSKDENDAMKRSILAFAGANLGDGHGIVTAADISKMNLRQCGIAVLSACESALGQIASDGVFGLQRGFKNAGVQTLLMSIRKVYDAPTTELMIQFYKSLIKGSTPNQALREAQQYLRKNGYDNPKYWASFIVLDGQ